MSQKRLKTCACRNRHSHPVQKQDLRPKFDRLTRISHTDQPMAEKCVQRIHAECSLILSATGKLCPIR